MTMICNWMKTELLTAGIMALFGAVGALADAPARIERYAKGLPLVTAEARPAAAPIMIVNPLTVGGIAGLFSTQPSTEERVRRLLRIARR